MFQQTGNRAKIHTDWALVWSEEKSSKQEQPALGGKLEKSSKKRETNGQAPDDGTQPFSRKSTTSCQEKGKKTRETEDTQKYENHISLMTTANEC